MYHLPKNSENIPKATKEVLSNLDSKKLIEDSESSTSLSCPTSSSLEASPVLISASEFQTPMSCWLWLQKKRFSTLSEQIQVYQSSINHFQNKTPDEYLINIYLNLFRLQSKENEKFSVEEAMLSLTNRGEQYKRCSFIYTKLAEYQISKGNKEGAIQTLQIGLENQTSQTMLIRQRLDSLIDNKPKNIIPRRPRKVGNLGPPLRIMGDSVKTNEKQSGDTEKMDLILTEKLFISKVEENLIVHDNQPENLEKENQRPPPATPAALNVKQHVPSSAQMMQQTPVPSQKAATKNALIVNNQLYAKLETIGKGGSSKVFKVLGPDGKIYALKRVGLKGSDYSVLTGYKNEIALLRKLSNCDRIIKLYDAEINEKDSYLHMVMEIGEIDLAHVLHNQSSTAPLGMNFIRVYWEQMLQAVQAIHEERIVHSDLKPANFLFVRGSLKLIDFGIAKAIQNDTTNIHRDHQVGTVNYMSPEAILDTNSMKEPSRDGQRQQLMKLGRPSDVWSLGCILYQMVYGKTPFHHLAMIPKLQKIIDPNFQIEYPQNNPSVIDCMKRCLIRDPKKRLTIPQLLEHPFLKPDEFYQNQLQSFSQAQIESIVKKTLIIKEKHPEVTSAQIAKVIYDQECRE